MCFHGLEACALAAQGFDDLLVAYPTTEIHTLHQVCERIALGNLIVLMVDNAEQVKRIAAVARAVGGVVPLGMDVGRSWHLPGVNFGGDGCPVGTGSGAWGRLSQCVRAV